MLVDPSIPAGQLLAAVHARYQDDDVEPGDALPALAYVANGQPGQLADAEPDPMDPHGALVVSLLRIDTQTVDAARARTLGATSTSHAIYQVRLTRRVATFGGHHAEPPTPEQVTTDSLTLARDAARLVDALHDWAATLTTIPTVRIGAVEPVGPAGWLSGNRVTVTVGPL